jgi:hypothetical protein
LGTIIDAFRKDGVSFLTPPLTEIKDETTIDIGHEALIRCWKKIAGEQDGWLKRETEDGIRWSLLLAEAKEFATNPKQVLSPAKAKDVKRWLATKAMQPLWRKLGLGREATQGQPARGQLYACTKCLRDNDRSYAYNLHMYNYN